MVNPYIPASESLSEGATGSRWDCPVCRQPVNRLRLAIPLLKCPHCRTRLCLRLPIPIKSVWLAAMLALVFFAYRWLSADPTRIIDHIWWLGLLPLPFVLMCITPVLLAFGIPCANNGFRNLTTDEIEGRRHEYLRSQTVGCTRSTACGVLRWKIKSPYSVIRNVIQLSQMRNQKCLDP